MDGISQFYRRKGELARGLPVVVDMVESVILLLIYIAVVVGLVWLVLWVLEQLGVALPAPVVKVLWVIAALIILLLLWRIVGHGINLRLP